MEALVSLEKSSSFLRVSLPERPTGIDHQSLGKADYLAFFHRQVRIQRNSEPAKRRRWWPFRSSPGLEVKSSPARSGSKKARTVNWTPSRGVKHPITPSAATPSAVAVPEEGPELPRAPWNITMRFANKSKKCISTLLLFDRLIGCRCSSLRDVGGDDVLLEKRL